MAAIEFWDRGQHTHPVVLEAAVYTLGSDAESVDVVVIDVTVSRVHAALERVGGAWLLRDLGSRNGTRVNGDPVVGQRRLSDGDEVLVGRTRFTFREGVESRRRPTTDALAAPPADLTRMERRVLIELCRPLVSHNTFQPPASVREIADRLFIGKNAVQAHLTNLYDKFGVFGDDGTNRRVLLANEAVQRGAVSIADIRSQHRPSGDDHERG